MKRNWQGGQVRKKGEKCALEEDLLADALQKGKQFFGFVSKGRFVDIGTPEDYARSSEVLSEREK